MNRREGGDDLEPYAMALGGDAIPDEAIYRATGWRDDGLTAPEAVYTRNGRMMSRKVGPKTRTHAEMLAGGCAFAGRFRRRRFVLDPP